MTSQRELSVPFDRVEIELQSCLSATDYTSLERDLKQRPGVLEFTLDRTTDLLDIRYDHNVTDAVTLSREMSRRGFPCCCKSPTLAADRPAHPMAMKHAGSAAGQHEGHTASMVGDMLRKAIVAAVLTIPIVAYSSIGRSLGFHEVLPGRLPEKTLGFLLATPIVFWAGSLFVVSAWRALLRREANMMTLIALGILVSYAYSVATTFWFPGEVFYDAAAMLTTFSLAGHWLEMRSRFATGRAVETLLKLAPATARVKRDGIEREIPLEAVVVGDELVVKPGDRIPVDGTVLSGSTYVDESMITGESAPVLKSIGSNVVAATVNKNGTLTFTATAVGADTALSRIVQMVKDAQASRAPAQEMADAAGKYLVYVAILAGVTAFAVWYFLGAGVLFAITAAVSTIIIACPDALALATPTAITVGVGKGAREGVLFKNATALEATAGIRCVVFDKTGTLTEGKPSLTDVLPVPDASGEEITRFAAAADNASEHPLANAIVEGARARNLKIPPATDFQALPGLGASATVDGKRVLVGNTGLMRKEGVMLPDASEAQDDRLAEQAKTPILVAIDGKFAGILAVGDKIRPSAIAAVKDLHAMNIRSVMITGDNRKTAQAVAHAIGIDDVLAQVLPHDKAARVKELQSTGEHVAMVGDGVNDAPALAQADVGIAIGAGTDVAIETADLVLMNSDPASVAIAIRIARAVRAKVTQNLFWASIYNVVAIPIAAGVLYPAFKVLLAPEWSALLMSASTITVTLNALLLNRLRLK
ncbi:MAG: heavy metal translocating P-type ATPase [Vulcanimicrobiaceae bacterium]